jgi:DNA-binding transcriptional regulator YiaG
MWRTFRNGQHLKTARVAAGLSQSALAQAARVHVNSIKYWERADGLCAGWAVDRLLTVLADRGVLVETVNSDDGRKIAIVRAG